MKEYILQIKNNINLEMKEYVLIYATDGKEFLIQKKDRGHGIFNEKTLFSMQIEEITNCQLPHLLRYEDRNSMAFSVEARLPFLDYRVVEFACRLPAELKIRDGWTKYILRRSMNGIMPDQIRWRKNKIGFEVTEKEWLAKLGPRMEKMFLSCDFHAKRYIDPQAVVRQAGSGRISWQLLWRAYNLELWMKSFGIG